MPPLPIDSDSRVLAIKASLLDALRAHVEGELDALLHSQRETQKGATHEESRAEHAKDTRATEQSYLARGLAERVEALRHTLGLLSKLELSAFGPEDPIGPTALVTILHQDDPEPRTWWLIPGAGGVDLSANGQATRTLTPVAPLGRALMGLQAGDEGLVQTPRGERSFEIVEVA